MKLSLNKIILCLTAVLALAACRSKQVVTPAPVEEPKPAITWHTCLVENAEGTVYVGKDTYRSSITMSTTLDSLIILSVTPMLGIELFRLEATPEEVVVVDKMQRRYIRCSYEDINRYVIPAVTYSDLQLMASGEVLVPEQPQGRYTYSALGKTIGLSITYPVRQLDTPIRQRRIDTTRYQLLSIEQFIQ